MFATRAGARSNGDRHYFTGKQCSNGHVAVRLVSNGNCLACKSSPEKRTGYGRSWRLINLEKCNNLAKSWRERNPERTKEISRGCYARNPEKAKAIIYAWRSEHPDHVRKYLSDWHDANPMKAREYTARRRSRKLAAEGTHGASDIDRIFKAQNGRCAMPWCRGKLKVGEWHVDHIVALSKGGTNWPSNLQIVHDVCNLQKSAKDPISHAQQNGMLL